MGLVTWIGDWLTRSSSGPQRKAHPDLLPIDVAKVTKELNLLSEAKRLGEAGIPAPDATAPCGPEAAAIERVEKFREDYVDWAVTRLGVVNENLSKGNVTQDVNRARQADQEFERRASTLLTEKDSLLRSYGELARRRKSELDAFKEIHQLARDAHYPAGIGLGLRWAFLAFLVVVEGLLNASFFAQGLDSGLIGGAAHAMGLATLNVGVAFTFGRIPVRYVCHSNLGLVVIGWLFAVLAFAAMTTIGLCIAHFRDALTAELPNASASALDALKAAPFHLRQR